MAFGEESGYPATRRQVQQLTELIAVAGHTDFRDARGPLGLTQRQANGKFTRDEADVLIAQLEADVDGDDASGADRQHAPGISARDAERDELLRKIPADLLAAELQQRGWIVLEP